MTTNTIILIDDDLSVNYFHRRLVTILNLTDDIHTFFNGKQALEGIMTVNKASEPGKNVLIFLDLNMPLMSGWEFLEEFEKLKHKLHINCSIHVISASLNPMDKEKAEQNPNVMSYISKPLSKETLLNCI
ncbi:response regulator [Flavobacterium sp. TBRC 19031]|uniref:response regulator n=1 Tax=Flavobacterium mekongense TaxID=3379707 RepID=UPI00399AD7C1